MKLKVHNKMKIYIILFPVFQVLGLVNTLLTHPHSTSCCRRMYLESNNEQEGSEGEVSLPDIEDYNDVKGVELSYKGRICKDNIVYCNIYHNI